jgi:hypothetical protein
MLPTLNHHDLDGCEDPAQVADRLVGIFDETGSLLDLSDLAPATFGRWLVSQRLLPDDKQVLLAGLSLRQLLLRAAERRERRSRARAAGLPVLDYAHDGEGVIRISLPRDFVGRIIVDIAAERHEASVLHAAIDDAKGDAKCCGNQCRRIAGASCCSGSRDSGDVAFRTGEVTVRGTCRCAYVARQRWGSLRQARRRQLRLREPGSGLVRLSESWRNRTSASLRQSRVGPRRVRSFIPIGSLTMSESAPRAKGHGCG